MPEGFPTGLNLTDPDWPDGASHGPGDADGFLPQGFLLGAPNVVFPYRGMASEDYYGAQAATGNPLTNAPLQDPCGGTVYFRTGKADDLKALVRIMGLRSDSRNYAAFALSSADPVNDRYLDQLKLITHPALSAIFKIDGKRLPGEQSLTIEEAVIGFVAAQREKWNHPDWAFSPKLRGTAGGDGDWAKESLAFGLHVENSYWGAYRIWSRPWLATK